MLRTYARLLQLIQGRERRRLYAVLVLLLMMGVVEMLGVASIFPLLAVLTNPGIVESNDKLNWLFRALEFTSVDDFLLFLTGATFVVVVGSILFKLVGLLLIDLFVRSQSYRLTVRLFTSYISLPYRWFLQQNSANLGKSILTEVELVVGQVLMPAIRLVAFSVIAILLAGLLVAVDPSAALLAMGMIGGAYGALYLLVRRLLSRVGKRRFEANAQRFRITQEAFSGIKEVKLMGLESMYLERLRRPAYQIARAQALSNILSRAPRHLIEAVALGTILLITLQMMRIGGEAGARAGLEQTLPFLGLFAFAAMRLFPALQEIYAALAAMRINAKALEALHVDLARAGATGTLEPGPRPEEQMRLTRDLEIRDLSFSYADPSRPTLADLSLRVKAHTSIGIVGGTGAGKTTLLDLILGLLRPDSGAILIDGVEINDANLQSWQRSIGYVPQSIFLIDDTVAANIAFGLTRKDIDMDRVREAARAACLDRFVETELDRGYDTVVGERGVRLSGGQRQRIGIARALYNDPSLIVFDEATSALDNLTERNVIEALYALSGERTIIMVAHRLTTVMDCDCIVYLEGGRILAAGTYHQLLDDCPAFRAVATANERA